MDRGSIGVLPRTPRLEDESQLDFYQSVRNLAILEMFPRVGQQIEAEAERQGFPNRGMDMPIERIQAIGDALPAAATWKRIMRSQQQATWNNIRASLLADETKYEQELKRAEQQRRDRLHYDTNFVTPEYAKFEIHLQPGGYVADTLAGYVFHHGTKVFYQGQNDQDELHHLVASMVREPNNGKVQRILDIGCSIGQGTTALKQRFPRAEVWGLDVALPMLRYGHKRAIDLGIDVHFKQALAEASGFPDDFFDVVLAHILFHEVPSMLFRPIVDEVRRVLRPGGTFTVVDAPEAAALPASNRMWLQNDSIYNCEPYLLDFVATDLPTLLGDAGFEFLHQGPTPIFLWCSQAAKPT